MSNVILDLDSIWVSIFTLTVISLSSKEITVHSEVICMRRHLKLFCRLTEKSSQHMLKCQNHAFHHVKYTQHMLNSKINAKNDYFTQFVREFQSIFVQISIYFCANFNLFLCHFSICLCDFQSIFMRISVYFCVNFSPFLCEIQSIFVRISVYFCVNFSLFLCKFQSIFV
jgi:hypothetical protein